MLRHSFLLRELVKRDFLGRYAGSALGLVWSFVQPLWLLLLYSLVFSSVLKVPLAFERTENFAVFLFCGLLPWTAISETLQRATTAITDNAPLVKKVRFPAALLIVAIAISALIHQFIAMAVFAVVLAFVGELGFGGLPLLLAVVPLQLALTVGLALLLAALNVFFRDVTQLLGMIFTGWFFLTPIVYPLSIVPTDTAGQRLVARVLEINPLTPLATLYREALLAGRPEWVPGAATLVVAAASALAFGAWLFRRLSPAFADEL